MEMEVEIGGRPKSLRERDGAALGLVDAVIPSHAAVQTEESPDEDAQYRGHHVRVIGQTVAQGEGHRKNPLACRNMGKDAIHQVGCGIGHTRPQQDGHTLRPLQDSGRSRSFPHDSHLSRKKPQANTPQDKYARISRSTNCGTSRPRSCWRARKVSRWAAIVRYSSESCGFRGRYSFLSFDPDRTQE